MPKKSRRRVNQTGEGDGRSRQDDNNNEGAVGDFDDLERGEGAPIAKPDARNDHLFPWRWLR
eukprot:scaffold4580_cov73-Skeletonema_dohrnii-CCMP3373.AAC.6